MQKVYIGGELFTEAEVNQRVAEGEELKYLGYMVYNPIANDEINDKSGNPTNEEIFMQDMSEILSSDVVTAPIDNEDPGLMMELGMVLSGNLFMEAYKQMEKELDEEALKIVRKYNPFKEIEINVIASDIRKPTAGDYSGIEVPKGYNQFVIGGLKTLGNSVFYNKFSELVEVLSARMNYFKKKGRE